jgi:hypothetical protein
MPTVWAGIIAPVKYLVPALCTAVLLAAATFVGSGYLKGRRADRTAAAQRSSVRSMSQQELAAAVARCDAMPASGQAAPRDAAYCEDVAREMDDRPLEIVKRNPPEAVPAPR